MSFFDPIPLDDASSRSGKPDLRPRLDDPPPVALNAVSDVVLPSAAGLESALNSFYVGLLAFRREPDEPGVLVFRADKHALRLDVLEPPLHREAVRPTRLSTDLPLTVLVNQLIELEIPYEWIIELETATRHVLLQDPAGNWLAIDQRSPLR
jgi:hypothetical protein